MAGVQVYFEGLQAVRMHFEAIRKRAPLVFRESLVEALDKPFQESQRLVPVDTGALKASGHIDDSESLGEEVVVEIVYDREYAFWVHERMDLKHAPPTQAKFLEQPVKAYYPMLSFDMAQLMKAKGATSK